MGRPKKFSGEEVLETAMSVSGTHGFSGTSLQDLDRATGGNSKGEQQGCPCVKSMREFAILPNGAYGVVTENG